nr:chemotaxis protein CheW [Gemmatimonadaceae bacterium]
AVIDGSIILAIHGARTVGIAVDEVMDVQVIREETVESGASDAQGLVRGLGRLDDGVVVLVDIHALVTQVLL